MKTFLLLWLSIHPVDHLRNPDRPLWANSQHVFVTPTGVYYEYIVWPTEHELYVGYWRQPLFSIKTFQWHNKQ